VVYQQVQVIAFSAAAQAKPAGLRAAFWDPSGDEVGTRMDV
jgi:hypothetical protein